MFMSHNQNARENHNLMIANELLKNVAKFKYLGNRNADHHLGTGISYIRESAVQQVEFISDKISLYNTKRLV